MGAGGSGGGGPSSTRKPEKNRKRPLGWVVLLVVLFRLFFFFSPSFLWRFVIFLFSDSLTLSRRYGGRGDERTPTSSDGMRVRDRDSYLCL